MVFYGDIDCPLLQFSPWESTLFLTAFLSVYVEDMAPLIKGIRRLQTDFISVNSKCSPAEENIYLDKNTVRVWLPELKTMADVASVMS